MTINWTERQSVVHTQKRSISAKTLVAAAPSLYLTSIRVCDYARMLHYQGKLCRQRENPVCGNTTVWSAIGEKFLLFSQPSDRDKTLVIDSCICVRATINSCSCSCWCRLNCRCRNKTELFSNCGHSGNQTEWWIRRYRGRWDTRQKQQLVVRAAFNCYNEQTVSVDM